MWETGKLHVAFWSRDLRERDHTEDLGVHGTIILILVFKKWDGELGQD